MLSIVKEINPWELKDELWSGALDTLGTITQNGKLQDLMGLLEEMYYDWKNGDISKEQYYRVREEAEKKLQQMRATLLALAAEQAKAAKGVQANSEYFERFLKYQNVEALDRFMLIELIHRIYIDQDKSVKVEFNFGDQYLRIMDFVQENTPEPEPEPQSAPEPEPLKLTLRRKD